MAFGNIYDWISIQHHAKELSGNQTKKPNDFD
jgi:hypothetical protein